jgi:hypothetical protein
LSFFQRAPLFSARAPFFLHKGTTRRRRRRRRREEEGRRRRRVLTSA